MSRYPEVNSSSSLPHPRRPLTFLQADEAQQRHYNDGYLPYPATTTPNPYDHQPNPYDRQSPYGAAAPLTDPFNPPAQNLYSSPPPQSNVYPPGPTYPPVEPPRFQTPGPPPSVIGTPSPYQRTGYDLQDEHDHEDTGDIPLLRRDLSLPGARPYSRGGMPGGFDDAATPDDRSESNIRYGRIPQRVPRRYKTIKKVE